jgi:hypothetical protein
MYLLINILNDKGSKYIKINCIKKSIIYFNDYYYYLKWQKNHITKEVRWKLHY